MAYTLNFVLETFQPIYAGGLLFKVDGFLLLNFLDSVLQYFGVFSELMEVVDAFEFFNCASVS
jgi:hypothetical protein